MNILYHFVLFLSIHLKNNVNDVNTKLSNGDILNKEYILKQNESLVKTNKYYYLEFQFIVQEPDYNTFNSKAKYIIDYPSSSSDEYVDQSTYYEYKTFYGKKNSNIQREKKKATLAEKKKHLEKKLQSLKKI